MKKINLIMLFFLSMFATLDGHTQVRGGELGGLTTIQEGVRNVE